MPRIGLFGGSFDPVHFGHLLMAQTACEEFELDKMFFIVASHSPLKPDIEPAPAKERLRLLRLALAGMPQYEIDEQEIKRGGMSYTIDTANDYLRRFPDAELYYLIGADHVPLLPRWRAASDLARLVQFLVIPRPGRDTEPFPAPFRGQVLKGHPLGVSSSEIRARVKAGKSIELLVPRAVAEAIRNNRLYL